MSRVTIHSSGNQRLFDVVVDEDLKLMRIETKRAGHAPQAVTLKEIQDQIRKAMKKLN